MSVDPILPNSEIYVVMLVSEITTKKVTKSNSETILINI